MKRIFFAVAALAIASAAALTPANAQVGVQVGPVGVGVSPYWDGYYHHRYYGDECRVIRERTETPSGRVIFRTHRICD